MSDTATSPFGFRDLDPREKVSRVTEVFARVAPKYDMMNNVMSLGIHHMWKDAACARLNPQPGEVILDVAGGTGDIARRLAKMARAAKARRIARGYPAQDAEIRVIDYNEQMILAGRDKGTESELSWSVGDALNLAINDASVDAYIISFGIRNVADVQAALNEARRVLKPGGRFLCLEFSHPTATPLAKAYEAYSFNVIPWMGKLVANDRDSYQYLVESIKRFPDQDTLRNMMEQAGFRNARYTNFSGGICALHEGWA